MTQSLKPNEQEEQMAGVRHTDGTSDADDKETQAVVLDLPHGFHLFIEDRSADTSGTEFNISDCLKNNLGDSVGRVTEIQPHGSRGAFVKFKTKELSSEAIKKLNKDKTIGVYSLSGDNNKLRIWNVPHNWTVDELKTAMREKVGDDNGVLSVHFMMEEYSDRKTGIILFCNKSCAEKAMRKMSEPGVKLGAHAPIVNWENHEDFVVPYTIKDKESYIKFITELREKLISRASAPPVYSKKKKLISSSSSSDGVVDYIFERDRAYPVIGKKAGWIFMELNAEDGRTTTLAIRKENLYVLGFKTQEHGWYELGESDKRLPKEYKAKKLGWGVSYTDIMKLNSGDQVEKTLRFTRLGKAFAERAVRRLARFSESVYSELVEKDDDRPTRLGLAGLIVMICEAARMNPFLDTFAGGWNEGTGLTTRLAGIMWDWGSMSAALLRWKESGYSKWPVRCKHSLAHALASVHLVLNSRNAIKGSDPAWVEIFGIEFPPDFNDAGITITVSDEQGDNSHIIYKQGKREYQKAISVYEWFRITVERAGIRITKEWGCHKPEGGYATGFDTRAIFLDSTRILVTYLVMTDAIEANVKVSMRIKGSPVEDVLDLEVPGEQAKKDGGSEYTVRGKIAAHIDGFDDYKIMLFDAQEGCKFKLFDAPEGEAITWTFPLERSDVRVPHGKRLHITEGLVITDASGKDVKISDHSVAFDSSSSPTSEVNDSDSEEEEEEEFAAAAEDNVVDVEVNVTWSHYQDKRIVGEPCIIQDKEEFIASIEKLRNMLAPISTEPRLLTKPSYTIRCIHIELQVGTPEQRSSITLAIRIDRPVVVGFMNQSGVWYHVGIDRLGLPLLSRGKYKYNSVGSGHNFYNFDKDILKGPHAYMHKLNSTKLTVEGFAKAAVRTLSRYPDVDVEEGDMNPRLAMVGLIIMLCESAKLEAICNFFVNGWDNTMELTPELAGYIIQWLPTSVSLLRWMVTGDWRPAMRHDDDKEHESWLNSVGIKTGEDAKKEIRLVHMFILFWRSRDPPYYRQLLNYVKNSKKAAVRQHEGEKKKKLFSQQGPQK